MSTNGDKVIALDKARMDAMAKKDIAALGDIIADDLIYTHSSARMDTKASLIGNMQSGSTVYTSVVPSEVVAPFPVAHRSVHPEVVLRSAR